MNTRNKKKILKTIIISLGVVAIIMVAAAFLWWYGIFLPSWIQWETTEKEFDQAYVTLEGRRITVRDGGKDGAVVWKTQGDWFVQNLVIKDIDQDGRDEMILLVWKHGSYGNHMPFWEKKNDKELRQHIYIYKYDETRESKIRAIWMSSQITYEITSISSGEKSYLDVTDRTGNTRVWGWREFGLKLVH
ncbi:MAG: hypothetical protein IK081_10935 [Lachnospiraceae bacterium]|nr:hypothetical protein [Lachnospiraceae bacterium]